MAAPDTVIHKPYRVVGKAHRVLLPGGTMQRFEVGDIIDTLRVSDLVAFKDRFAPATQDEVDAYHTRQASLIADIEQTPIAADARQAAAERASLEAQLATLTQQVQDAKAREALAIEAQHAAEAQAKQAVEQAAASHAATTKAEADKAAADKAAGKK